MGPNAKDLSSSIAPEKALLRRAGKSGLAMPVVWALSLVMAACSAHGVDAIDDEDLSEPVAEAESAVKPCPQPQSAVGLALQIENGAGLPLQLRAGQAFYVNQIDVRAAIDASVDEGVDGLTQSGDFASLPWDNVHETDEDVTIAANPDGTFSRRRYYRDATWMDAKSAFVLTQVDAKGKPLGKPLVLSAGSGKKRQKKDSFFVRRMRAIQWTTDCASATDCSSASHFEEEALVELRNATDRKDAFTLHPAAAALQLRWSLRGNQPYVIPVQQIAHPQYEYGFSMDIDVLTPPGPNGAYPIDSDISFQITLRDGAGNRLHPPGALPSYMDVMFGQNPAGIQYYRGLFDPSITYYRRKHLEGLMGAQIVGPAPDIKNIHSIYDLDQIFADGEVMRIGLPSRDGFFAESVMFPRAVDTFGGAFDPMHLAWFKPVSDTWTHHIPADAKPGTYLVTAKARRSYLGEQLPITSTIKIQIGTPSPTSPKLHTSGCANCHSGGGALGEVLHGNGDLATCSGCHAPLGVEHDNVLYSRVHFIHSRSNRVEAPLSKCSMCHDNPEASQRTSKSACMSCHTSYPASHVAEFGPINSPFVGGGRESFQQCTSTCHVSHPGSGFN